MTATAIHPVHAANMVAKAARLADFLRSNGAAYANPDIVTQMSDKRWAMVAEMAGEQVPSPATRAAVVVLLRREVANEIPTKENR